MNPTTRKMFFWVFGLFFSLATYIFIEKTTFFIGLKENIGVSLIISLVIIILFFIIGLFSEMIDIPIKYLFISKKKINLSRFSKEVEHSKKSQELKIFSKNLRKTLDYIVKQNYSKESIDLLKTYVGFDNETVKAIIFNTKRLRKIKMFYWIIGFSLAIVNLVLSLSLPFFDFIRVTWYVPYGISLTLFLLFFIEGCLVTRVPCSFYLDILKAHKKKLKTTKNKLKRTKKKKKKVETKKQNSLENIINSLSYMLSLNIDLNKIYKFLEKEGVDKQTAKQLIETSKLRQKKVASKESPLLLKLFLSNIHDELISLKQIYSQISNIEGKIQDIEQNQLALKKLIENKKNNLKTNQARYVSKDTQKDFTKTLETKTSKVPITPNYQYLSSKNKEKETEDPKIRMIYETIKPYAEIYTKEQIESFLIGNNIDLTIVEDVMEMFKKERTSFSENKKTIGTQFVFFVNNIYDTLKKNNVK